MSALHRTGFASIPHLAAASMMACSYTTRTSSWRCAARRLRTSRCPKKSRAASIIWTPRSTQLPRAQVVVALGKIAFDVWLQSAETAGRRHRITAAAVRDTAVMARVDAPDGVPALLARVLPPKPSEHEYRKADAGR